MITGDHDKLKDIAKFNVCAVHKTPLEVAWYGAEKTWVLRCGHDHYPDAVTRALSLTEEVKSGAAVMAPVRDKIIEGGQRRMVQQGRVNKGEEYGLMPMADLGTGGALALPEIKMLLMYAEKSKLDPWLGHVVLMYGKPYITIDGYLYHAKKSGKEYSLESRPMTTEEVNAFHLGATDHGWITFVTFVKTGEKFTGTGVVTYTEMTEESKKHPGQAGLTGGLRLTPGSWGKSGRSGRLSGEPSR